MHVNSLQGGLSNLLSVWVYLCRSLPVFVLLGKLWDKHFQYKWCIESMCYICHYNLLNSVFKTAIELFILGELGKLLKNRLFMGCQGGLVCT